MSKKITLNALRHEIDAIDDSIHDLIIRRTEVVRRVRELKRGDEIKIRPAREAEMIRRLLRRHHGPFPKCELVRIWRELIVATLAFEGPFSVAVYDPGEGKGLWYPARDQFGSFTPMKGYASPRLVIDAVQRRQATLGILPVIGGEGEPWWRHIAFINNDAPKIIARLPFAGPANGPGGNIEAMVICPVPQEPTGRDRSLFVFETVANISLGQINISLGQIKTRLTEAGMDCRLITQWSDNLGSDNLESGDPLCLVEIDDFITDKDPRLKNFQQAIGPALIHTIPIGGYAVPLSDDELKTEDAVE